MQRRLRQFLAEYNQRNGVTVLLTSHYMADVVALCQRVILIHEGKLLFDGPLNDLADQLAPFKLIRIELDRHIDRSFPLPESAQLLSQTNGSWMVRTERTKAPDVTAQLLQSMPIVDLAVEDPPIEAVIDQIYSGASVNGETTVTVSAN
ncbi:hypothetical protein KFU94_64650 [Chloroflexi bacterium TSY]|nr:hypothetical protein [Chloroflexi bacterium TSY]